MKDEQVVIVYTKHLGIVVGYIQHSVRGLVEIKQPHILTLGQSTMSMTPLLEATNGDEDTIIISTSDIAFRPCVNEYSYGFIPDSQIVELFLKVTGQKTIVTQPTKKLIL